MNHFLVAEVELAGDRLDGVDVADEVGDGDVGGGQLLVVSLGAVEPGDGGVVASFEKDLARLAGDGGKGGFIDGRAFQDRDILVEQIGQLADDAGLGLASKTKKKKIMPRKDRRHDLGDNGLVVANDPREQRLAVAQLAQEILAHLVLHAAVLPTGSLQFTQRRRLVAHVAAPMLGGCSKKGSRPCRMGEQDLLPR